MENPIPKKKSSFKITYICIFYKSKKELKHGTRIY